MSGLPAYRYNVDQYSSSTSAPKKNYNKREIPDFKVVSGGKATTSILSSPNFRLILILLSVVLICFVVFGFARVFISTQAYDVASKASEVRSDISEARSEQEALAVTKSSVANPITLREKAQDSLNMSVPSTIEEMELEPDVVVVDSSGNLSLTQSLAQLAALA